MENTCQNTDKEIWRERLGDYYSNSIHVTKDNSIGIDCGGHVLVAPIKKWHDAGKLLFFATKGLPEWRRKIAIWLLEKNLKRGSLI